MGKLSLGVKKLPALVFGSMKNVKSTEEELSGQHNAGACSLTRYEYVVSSFASESFSSGGLPVMRAHCLHCIP